MSEIQFYNKKNYKDLNWKLYHNGENIYNYLLPFLINGTSAYIDNSNCEIEIIAINNELIPISLPEQHANPCYVTNLSTQYFTYVKSEVLANDKYSKTLKITAKYLIPLVQKGFALMGFNKAVLVNNWLFSSNLQCKLSKSELEQITIALTNRYKNYAIVWKGVDELIYSDYKAKLAELHFMAISGRMLYVLNTEGFKLNKKRPLQQDKKRWLNQNKYQYEILNNASNLDLKRILQFYTQLYIDKYSELNPKYNLAFLNTLFNSKIYDFWILRNLENNQIEAIQIVSRKNQVSTTPFIGYNQQLSINEGLYKHLSYLLIEDSLAKDQFLNMSSGADQFKKQRGGKASFEYNMAYINHLQPMQKIPFKILKFLGDKYAKKTMHQVEN